MKPLGTCWCVLDVICFEHIWLCSSHGHHRVASPGFKLKTKVFLVAQMVLCDAHDWHRAKYTQNKWRPNINVDPFCFGAQPYHRTVPVRDATAGMGRTTQSLMGPFVYLALWRVMSPGFELKTWSLWLPSWYHLGYKVFLVALLVPSELLAQMVPGGQPKRPWSWVRILGRPLCDAHNWHRAKYTKNKWRPNNVF